MGIFPSTNSCALKAKMSSAEIPYFLLKSSLVRELVGPPSTSAPDASLCSDKVQSNDSTFGAGI